MAGLHKLTNEGRAPCFLALPRSALFLSHVCVLRLRFFPQRTWRREVVHGWVWSGACGAGWRIWIVKLKSSSRREFTWVGRPYKGEILVLKIECDAFFVERRVCRSHRPAAQSTQRSGCVAAGRSTSEFRTVDKFVSSYQCDHRSSREKSKRLEQQHVLFVCTATTATYVLLLRRLLLCSYLHELQSSKPGITLVYFRHFEEHGFCASRRRTPLSFAGWPPSRGERQGSIRLHAPQGGYLFLMEI